MVVFDPAAFVCVVGRFVVQICIYGYQVDLIGARTLNPPLSKILYCGLDSLKADTHL